ncbi:hypothetical protein NQ317_005212 [Molorchus minor]|uniref:FMN hydroxy acid dehydrogenase domain-containing protein n=1 Tax=Molorchus minor TaxID=1323400 RepID=A0ABQ9JQV6_9CUCU|nr:hypothetical protein NQ317_005212 [Molorchus minor]
MNINLVCIQDFEDHAFKVLPRSAFDFFRGGAGQETTLAYNNTAFSKFKIRPRCLKNVAQRDISTTVLGEKVSVPIGIAPSSLHKIAHPDGECATARAAQALGVLYTLSTGATCSIEEVAEAAPNGLKWFQIYVYKNRKITEDLIRRAEKAGYKALVVTVDVPVVGIRLADIRNRFSLPPHLGLANFEDRNSTDLMRSNKDGSGLANYVNSLFDASLEWRDIQWLKGITSLPIVLKGILTVEDALLAVEAGVEAVWVSNHGGRQLDGTPASIEVLPEIVKAVDGKVEIYLDGGVREGTDVFKALALGARMVFLGRPPLWGLAHSGEEGVEKVLQIIMNEFESTLGLSDSKSDQDV